MELRALRLRRWNRRSGLCARAVVTLVGMMAAGGVLSAPVGAEPAPATDPAIEPVVDAAPVGPPPDTGVVASADPAMFTTPDGWKLTLAAKDETQLPVAPLTTALSSRDFLVGGTFFASVTGAGKTKLTGGTLEVGYQIGCGIDMANSSGVSMTGTIGATPSVGLSGSTFASPLPTGFIPALSLPVSGSITVYLKPGIVNIVPVDKLTYAGSNPRDTISGFHIKIDGCVGQAFIRSYATLTSTTADTHDVLSYMGTTKAV
jgi:hypothetical protein